MKLERLVITCGGTGGHFFPGLSIAREFQKQGGRVCLLLSGEHAEEQREIAERFGISARALPRMPNPRKSPLRFVGGCIGGVIAALGELRRFRAQAMLGMGSFATLPVVLAAVLRRVPVFLHDGNARIGKANRCFSRIARALGTGFPAVNPERCRCRLSHTGMPVRPELRRQAGIGRAEAVAALNERFRAGFSPDLPIILVTGGSQGAAIFNQILPEALSARKERFQVIHLTGKGKLAEAERIYGTGNLPRLLLESCAEMELCLGAADLVFSRSGGSTVAELALFGKASVLIPYPYAAEGHQRDNAEYFAVHDAAVIVENSAFTVTAVHGLLDDFFAAPEKWRSRGDGMRRLAVPDAAERMLAEISAVSD